jgi:hypothetical protein
MHTPTLVGLGEIATIRYRINKLITIHLREFPLSSVYLESDGVEYWSPQSDALGQRIWHVVATFPPQGTENHSFIRFRI